MIHQCPCGFATDDAEWFESHQDRYRHGSERDHDVRGLTVGELERARRELAVSLALVRPGSPARVPILARMSAIDAVLGTRPEQLPGSPFVPESLAGFSTTG
ncbi:MAG: hypothetical protein ACRDPD_35230 [Streptosporangiaceae bacterium]